MNNSAFKDLVSSSSKPSSSSSPSQHGSFKKPATALGSRMRSSIPMTPRSLPGQKNNSRSDFVRQVAEATASSFAAGSGEGPPLKKFKSNAAPKGTKLASGYTDRASLLRNGSHDEESSTDKEKRVKALEEMYKLQQIDLETFERLRDEIGVGGDVNSTHLVRGLDWKLLARVRRGEDVSKAVDISERSNQQSQPADIDDEFDKVLEKEVDTNATEQVISDEDVGDLPDETSAEIPQQRLSRDEVLRRFRENRGQNGPSKSSSEPPKAPVLNDRFKKIPTKAAGPKKEKFIESVDGRRREVLLITNPDGSTKRKTRWLDPAQASDEKSENRSVEDQQQKPAGGDLKDKPSKKQQQSIMGMEIPAEIASREAARKAAETMAEEDDDDIFQGVGDNYDPLGDISSSGDDSGESVHEAENDHHSKSKDDQAATDATVIPSLTKKRNYFANTGVKQGQDEDGDEDEDEDGEHHRTNPMTKDPTILAALKRAAEIRKREESNGLGSGGGGSGDHQPGDSERSKAFLAKLRERDRQDAADLDMGFGGSRFDDDDDEGDGQHGDLLDFADGDGDGGDGGDDDGGGGDGRARKRGKSSGKRGMKKKKGDKNNIADVMGAMASRKP